MIRSQLDETVRFLTEHGFHQPHVGVVLGTGLGDFVRHIENPHAIAYTDIPHFPKATVESHKGKLIFGNIGHTKVVVMQGRFHYYEGYSLAQVTIGIRVMKLLGVKFLLLSNAAGGINLNYKKGDLVILTDHINLLPDNPLRGANLDSLGPRFPDMSAPYNKELNALLKKHLHLSAIQVNQGVYAAVAGPNLETRAEYRFLKIIGADMVGMSTVPEVIVANHMGLPCAAVSVITDECDPDQLKPINIDEIIAVANQADKKLSTVFMNVIKELAP